MPPTVVRSGQILDGSLTDVDVAAANKDGTAATPSLRTLGTGALQAAAGNDARLGLNIDSDARVFQSPLVTNGTFLLISGTAYFVYLGRTLQSFTPKFVEFFMSTAGAGAQTAEIGFFSTPNAPGKAGQTLTKLATSNALDSLTATLTVKRNTSALAIAIAAGVHLWAGIRVAMATTQPTLRGLQDDWGEAQILALAGAGTFAATATFAGAVLAAATQITCPALRATMD